MRRDEDVLCVCVIIININDIIMIITNPGMDHLQVSGLDFEYQIRGTMRNWKYHSVLFIITQKYTLQQVCRVQGSSFGATNSNPS